MNGYPKFFFLLVFTILVILLISGVLLVPAFLFFRMESNIAWLMDFPFSSGDLRHLTTSLHAISGWLMVWFIGAIWTIHMRSHWRRHENRLSGVVFTSVWAFLIVSSLGIYYFGDPDLSQLSSLIHVGLGLLIPFALLAHRKAGRKSLQAKVSSYKTARPG
ncbi:hypothetical protein GHNINEIG_00427 [Hydrogenovibrio crunogenus]|uniref:DUF4405 domain-containing protein n=1 Tax=Hydrogenovibrio crunogenus TaxID=39765 RepID=A0A4P7NXF1_9GAMM|nr:hypothetical protein [Hydrogenovibrio crunogenus]QBZ82397.1 hypothetical protein GHNINEIG_00427 [Hydrogenovibrio crunogenus]RUM91621.1 MAG: hypothetical protein DSZ27_06195 [Thiomicrospira sp.]